LWPAFWLLGDNIPSAGWPTCGEIDIMENIGKEPGRIHGTVHGPGYSGAGGISSAYDLPAGAFADTFHVYAIEWEPAAIRWYVDDGLESVAFRNADDGSKALIVVTLAWK